MSQGNLWRIQKQKENDMKAEVLRGTMENVWRTQVLRWNIWKTYGEHICFAWRLIEHERKTHVLRLYLLRTKGNICFEWTNGKHKENSGVAL